MRCDEKLGVLIDGFGNSMRRLKRWKKAVRTVESVWWPKLKNMLSFEGHRNTTTPDMDNSMMDGSCERFWEMAQEALPGPPKGGFLRKHLGECNHCREEYERLQTLMTELKTHLEGPRENEFWMELRSSVKKELDFTTRGFSWGTYWWTGAVGTVALALLIFLTPLKTGPHQYIQPSEYLSTLPGYTDILWEYGDHEGADIMAEADYMRGMTGLSSVLVDLYDRET